METIETPGSATAIVQIPLLYNVMMLKIGPDLFILAFGIPSQTWLFEYKNYGQLFFSSFS